MSANVGGRVRVNHAEVERLMSGSEMARELGRKAEVGVQVAKRLAPTSPAGHDGMGSGHLRSSVQWTLGRDAKGLYVDIFSDADEALFVEFGTRAHVIESHGDYPLRNARTGQVFGRHVNHPGTSAQPFLRPGLRAAAEA